MEFPDFSAQLQIASLQDVWMFVAIKLFAVALVSCVSMKDAWKWPVAFSLGMGTLVSVCQPYADPQAGTI